MLTKGLRLVLLVSVAFVVTARAIAGSCAPGVGTAKDRLAANDAVFVGRVLELRFPPKPDPAGPMPGREVVFEIKMGWRGVHHPRILVINHPVYEAPFELGQDFLVFAKRLPFDPRLVVIECGETVRMDSAGD